MLKKLSAAAPGTVPWIAAGVIIILLAAFWLFTVRKPATPGSSAQKFTKTVFQKKIPQTRKLAANAVTKKIATVKPPVKPPASIKTQRSPEAKTPIITKQPEKVTVLKTPATIKAQQIPETKITAEPAAQTKTEQPQLAKPLLPKPIIATLPQTGSPPKTAPQAEAKPAQSIPVPVKAKPVVREIHREEWLLAQDAAAYTIQIVGVSNEKTMLDFIKHNQLLKQNDIAYYESTFNGKPWYQLLYGRYPTKQAARLVANKLPEDIRRAGPWLRTIARVQKTIRAKRLQ